MFVFCLFHCLCLSVVCLLNDVFTFVCSLDHRQITIVVKYLQALMFPVCLHVVPPKTDVTFCSLLIYSQNNNTIYNCLL